MDRDHDLVSFLLLLLCRSLSSVDQHDPSSAEQGVAFNICEKGEVLYTLAFMGTELLLLLVSGRISVTFVRIHIRL